MILPIVTYPDEILTKRAAAVTEITNAVIQLLDDMQETMQAYDGVGLAAPQVGQSLRVAIVETDDESGPLELINPKLIMQEGEAVDVEGCLSFPDVFGTVKRAAKIAVRYVDREGYENELVAHDYAARIIQHEIEHLDGGLFTDRMIRRLTPEELEEYMEEHDDD
ncbi:peptide deformylase [Vagococcus acidifermentans]|nr:peptide deformylase [Vagococcus acidifermentans]